MLRTIADDLGLHKSVNSGIVFLLREGKIDGASLMANGEEFEDAVRQCLENKLSNVGVHLNLVEQQSVLSGKPMLKNHRVFFIKYILGLVKKEILRKELEAQVKKIVQAGIKPIFLNGNQHLHLLPGIMDITIRLAKEYQIPYIRIINEPASLKKGSLFRELQLVFLNFLSKSAKRKIKKAGLECNDYFVGFIDAGVMSFKTKQEAEVLAEKYPDKVIELGCHPGYESESLRKKFKHWGNYNWEEELNLLRQQ
ncbi:MAG TPA: ChbG/HpnK family deacetylase [Candidatus Paceibacterota bacterium]